MLRGRILFLAMSALVALFVLRVAAQLLQAIYPVEWIPAYEDWHSGVVPYPVLLAIQFCVIYLMSYTLHRARTRKIRPKKWKYVLCYACGTPYLSFMTFRWIAGMTFLADSSWFSRSLPAFFHIVLASFILVLGFHIHDRYRKPKIFSSLPRI